MVAKLVVFMLVIAIVLSVAVIAAYRYFKQREEHRHEKEMLREKRDAEMLTDDSYIERELENERNR